jgi:UDP-GlcNAc3NAcA epimerase
MKLAHIVGARPQFIKAAMLSRAFAKAGIDEILIHSGQHYDENMSDVFFEELDLPKPHLQLLYNPNGTVSPVDDMSRSIEAALEDLNPDLVLVHGDTSTTLAGASAASRLNIPLAHNEAGLRSYNNAMPEERNRVLSDQAADILFCPTQSSVERLQREGITEGVYFTGDVMLDALQHYAERAGELPDSIEKRKPYTLVTIHRNYTADQPERMEAFIRILEAMPMSVVLPLHPRTAKRLKEFNLSIPEHIHVVDSVGYLEMISLERNAGVILTDSGGVQKEAYFLGIPCITLRPETEWTETVDAGWNIVADLDKGKILNCLEAFDRTQERPSYFGDGNAAERITKILLSQRF